MVVTHERVLSLSLSSLFLLFFFETSIHTLHTSTLSLSFFFLSTPDSHIEALERAQKRLEKERERGLFRQSPSERKNMVLKIFVATKNAHVFASSSFVGLGVLIFSKNRKKERRHHHSDDDDEERERERNERERGKEEEEDVLRLFVFFFSEFRRDVVFVSRVESQRG